MQAEERQDSGFGYEWIACPVCGNSEETEVLFSKRYDGFVNLEGFNECFISQCRHCGLVYFNPRLTLPLYRRLYPSLPRDEMLMRNDAVYMGLFHDKYVDLFMKPITKQFPKPKVLDFICQDGHFLHSVKRRYPDTDLYGCDFRQGMVQRARQKGIETHCGLIEEAGYPGKFFDAIMTRHTLEHLYNPVRAFAELHRILKDEGLLIVEVPNVDSLARKVFGKAWTGWFERHVYYFSRKTSAQFLEKVGFSVEKAVFPFYLSYTWDISLGKILIRPLLKRFARTPRGKTTRSLRPLRKRIGELPVDPLWLASLPLSFVGSLFRETDVMVFFARKKLA